MRLPIVLTTIMLAASLLPGQEKPESLEAVVIPVKTLSGDSFNRLAKLLGVFGAKFTADDKLRTIVVYASKDVVTQMRHVVEQLDQPGSEAAIGRNIEMTLAFLRCFTTAQPDARPTRKRRWPPSAGWRGQPRGGTRATVMARTPCAS